MAISKALVVDDSRLARVALTKMLTRRGLAVDTAESGTDALAYLRDATPDVVFIDYMMPDMDGFEAAEAINRLRGRRALPLVMYTSQDSDDDRRRASELGICGFLTKPTSDQGLDAVLSQLDAWRASSPAPVEDAVSADVRAAYVSAGAEAVPPPEPDAPIAAPVDAATCPSAEHAAPAQATPARRSSDVTLPPAPDFRTGLDEAAVRAIAVEVVEARSPDVRSDTVEASVREAVNDVEQRLRGVLDDMDQRWQRHLEKTGADWRDGLKGFGESVHEAAAEAATLSAQQLAERLVHDARQEMLQRVETMLSERTAQEPMDIDSLEQQLRDTLVAEVQASAEESAVSAARRQAGVTAAEVARELATSVAAESARQQTEAMVSSLRAELSTDADEVGQQAADAVATAVSRIAESEAFQVQLVRLVNEHGVPVLKNRLDHWVEERARAAVDALIAERLEQTVDAMVRQAVTASASAAVREADALHARTRRQFGLTAAALAVGVVVALAIGLV